MSQAVDPQKVKQVLDPRLNLKAPQYYAAIQGAGKYNIQSYTSSASSASALEFAFALAGGTSTVISRRVLLSAEVNVVFTGRAPVGQTLLSIGSFDSARAYPMNNIMSSVNVTLNQSKFTFQPRDILPAMLHIRGDQLRAVSDSCPNMPDNCQSYDSFIATLRNPMGNVTSTQFGTAARGAFAYEVVLNETSANPAVDIQAMVRIRSIEPVFCSPFDWSTYGLDQGLSGIQNMVFSFQFDSKVERIWSHAASSGATLSAVTLGGTADAIQYDAFSNAKLYFETLTPKITVDSVPARITTDYYEVRVNPVSSGFSTIAAGATSELVSGTIQMQQIPSKIVVFARRSNATQGVLTPDSFLAIETANFQWCTSPGLLSTATQTHLYEISRRNGVTMPWNDWCGVALGQDGDAVGTTGSVLVVEPGIDLQLNDGEAPGLPGNFQLSLQLRVRNTGSTSVSPALYVVAVNDCVLTLDNGSSTQQQGVMNSMDVLNAKPDTGAPLSAIQPMVGGSFLDSLKSAWTGYVKPGLSLASQGLNAAQKAGIIGSALVREDAAYGGKLLSHGKLSARLR
jgi:hypothetical protein